MKLGRICGYDDKSFDIVKSQGLDFIEICRNYEKDADDFVKAVEDVKKNMKRTGLYISSVGRWNHDIQQKGKLVKEKVAKYNELLDAAIEVGAKTFVCGINYDESVSLFKNYDNAIKLFGSFIERANGKIKIAVQNCHWNNFVLSPREWEVVLGALPELGIKYDPSHAYNRHADYLEEMSDWGERIFHFHVKGTVHAGKRPVDDPPAGMDDIQWPSVMAVLYARKYDGDLSIEPHSATWNGERGNNGVKFTAKYIRQFML